MGAVHLRLVGQACEFHQGRRHLFRCTFEQATAAAGKQRIAAEQPVLFSRHISDMAGGMARDVQHIEAQRQIGQDDGVAFAKRVGDAGDRLLARPVDGHVEALLQLDVVERVVVVLVRVDEVRHRHAELGDGVEQRLDRCATVDQHGRATGPVGDEVGVGQVRVVHAAANDHGRGPTPSPPR